MTKILYFMCHFLKTLNGILQILTNHLLYNELQDNRPVANGAAILTECVTYFIGSL